MAASPRGHIWQDIDNLRTGRRIVFRHIKAHQARPHPYHDSYVPWLGNNVADNYAKQGASMNAQVQYGQDSAMDAMHHIRHWT
eukprot:4499746-Amphidinium_carterae.1